MKKSSNQRIYSQILLFHFIQTNNESNMDLWILSRLASAVEACNKGFAEYEFSAATNASYNFWLYDLCDVYLVRISLEL